MTENEIIKACQKQERSGQQALFELFFERIMAVCLRYSKNKQEANEILCEGFTKVFLTINNFNYSTSLERWVKELIIDTAINYLQRNKPEYSLITNDTSFPRYKPEELSWRTTDDILKALQELSPVYRLIFNLHIMEGYSHSAIDEKLELQEGSSVSDLAKAKFSFKRSLLLSKKILALVDASTSEIDISIKEAFYKYMIPFDPKSWVEMEGILDRQPLVNPPLKKLGTPFLALAGILVVIIGFFSLRPFRLMEKPSSLNNQQINIDSNSRTNADEIKKDSPISESQKDSIKYVNNTLSIKDNNSTNKAPSNIVEKSEKLISGKSSTSTNTVLSDNQEKTKSNQNESNAGENKTELSSTQINYSSDNSLSKPIWDFLPKVLNKKDAKKPGPASLAITKSNLFDEIHTAMKKNVQDSSESNPPTDTGTVK